MNAIFSPHQSIAGDFAWAFVRILIGAMLIYHGWEVFDAKLMNDYSTWDQFRNTRWPLALVYLGKGSELVAGILLLLGLFTRIAGFICIGTFAYISFFVGHGIVWYTDQHPFLLVLFGLLYFAFGAGSFSLDRLFFSSSTYHSSTS